MVARFSFLPGRRPRDGAVFAGDRWSPLRVRGFGDNRRVKPGHNGRPSPFRGAWTMSVACALYGCRGDRWSPVRVRGFEGNRWVARIKIVPGAGKTREDLLSAEGQRGAPRGERRLSPMTRRVPGGRAFTRGRKRRESLPETDAGRVLPKLPSPSRYFTLLLA